MNRRDFLKTAALGGGGIILLRHGAWAARAFAESADHSRMIVVFLRGAVDGLNVVPPHGDPIYYQARARIAVPKVAVQNLDGHFGLHPALASLIPLWRERSLAFVHACGSPDPSRSHFDAQDYMEAGTPGIKSTPDGWMNRLLAALPGRPGPTEAINLGPTLPRILSGRMAVANLPMGRGAQRPMPLDRPAIETAFARMYQGRDPLSLAFQEGRQARQKLLGEMEQEMKAADNGAPSPNQGFQDDAARLAHLMARDPGIRLAFIALGGWDTHVNQGSEMGQLANHLRPLGDGLFALVRGLGPAYENTTIVVLSEFGRTVRENGNGGTDHGHGNVMWVMGGKIRGGKVYGIWPGLSGSDLYQGRDLAVTTDFRSVLWTLISRHMRIGSNRLQNIFPRFSPDTRNVAGLIAA